MYRGPPAQTEKTYLDEYVGRAIPSNPKTDIPISTVLIVGVIIWMFIFGAVFSYLVIAPCNFISVTSGGDAMVSRAEQVTGLNLHNDDDCRTFLKSMILGTPLPTTK